jgi:hypothetical protein
MKIEDLSCSFEAEGLQSATAYAAAVDPGSKVKLEADCRFRLVDGGQAQMRVKCTYWAAGEKKTLPEQVANVVVKSLVERKERRFR